MAIGDGLTHFDGVHVNTEAVRVANKTGSALTAGTLVYVTGYDATLGAPSVTKADADTGGKVAELVIAESIANDRAGTSYKVGIVKNIDTSGASAVGSSAYLSATAGEFVWAALTGADQVVQVVGVCVTKSATTGSILFYPSRRVVSKTGGSLLQGLTATAEQLNRTAVTTPGTVEASKTLVADANKAVNELNTAKLQIGASGAEVDMTGDITRLHAGPVFSVVKEMTDALWTSGATIIPAVTGKSIVPLNITVVSKTALTCTATTDVTLVDTTASPVTVLTLAVANLSGSNAVLTQGSTGFTAALPALTGIASGKGLVASAVADVTSTTSSTWIKIVYTLV